MPTLFEKYPVFCHSLPWAGLQPQRPVRSLQVCQASFRPPGLCKHASTFSPGRLVQVSLPPGSLLGSPSLDQVYVLPVSKGPRFSHFWHILCVDFLHGLIYLSHCAISLHGSRDLVLTVQHWWALRRHSISTCSTNDVWQMNGWTNLELSSFYPKMKKLIKNWG